LERQLRGVSLLGGSLLAFFDERQTTPPQRRELIVTGGESALLLPAASMARTWLLKVLAFLRWSVKVVALCWLPMAVPSRKTRYWTGPSPMASNSLRRRV
jgi:hypothetical protein